MNTQRISRVREEMKQHSFDQLVITSPDSIFYLTGIDIHPGERLFALLIDQERCHLFLSALFPLKEETLPVTYFTDDVDSIALLSKSIIDQGVIGIDKFWESHFLLRLMKIKNNLSYEIGSIAVDNCRLTKDEDEREKMRHASKLNDEIMSEIISYIYNEAPNGNLTELKVQNQIKKLHEDKGIHELSFTPSVCFGANGAEPHHDCDDTVLKEGMAVVIDMGGKVNGYCSDMTRSFFYGDATENYTKVYNLVKAANEAAIKVVKPGVKLSDVDKAAREIIENAGYGAYFTHRTGHGIGIQVHEFPDVSSVSQNTCLTGMAFSIEPGIYLKDQFGVRIEDLVLVTEEGVEVLNRFMK